MAEEKMRHVVDLILEGDEDDLQQVEEQILLENNEEKILRQLGDPTQMNYLLMFEQYLDEHDLYLFDGWEDAKFVGRPIIDTFWTTFHVWVTSETDLRGAMRLKNDKEGQNKVMQKKLSNGDSIIKFKILRRYLDHIEQRNKEKAEQLANEELEKMT